MNKNLLSLRKVQKFSLDFKALPSRKNKWFGYWVINLFPLLTENKQRSCSSSSMYCKLKKKITTQQTKHPPENYQLFPSCHLQDSKSAFGTQSSILKKSQNSNCSLKEQTSCFCCTFTQDLQHLWSQFPASWLQISELAIKCNCVFPKFMHPLYNLMLCSELCLDGMIIQKRQCDHFSGSKMVMICSGNCYFVLSWKFEQPYRSKRDTVQCQIF